MKLKFFLYLLLYLCCFIGARSLVAQRPFTSSLSMAVLDHHAGVPFINFGNKLPYRFNPGLALSFESSRERNGAYQFSRVIQVGYYYHKDDEQVAFLALKPKLSLMVGKLIDLHLVPGLGYAHSFPTRPSYVLESGTYVERANPGKGHFMPSLGLGAGLNLRDIIGVPVGVFARYESIVLFPSAHTLTHLGVTLSLR